MARVLTESEERRRIDLIGLKDYYSLTNQGISRKLPPGMGSKRTVDKWVSGATAVPVIVMEVLYYKLEGKPIQSKEENGDV